MAYKYPASPAARAVRALKPARTTTGAVAGAEHTLRDIPAGPPGRERADLSDEQPKALSPQRRRTRARRKEAEPLLVVDDLPRPVPIVRSELAAIEIYIGTAIDALLRELDP